MKIDALSLAFESDGHTYFVNTKQEDWTLILRMVQGMSQTGKLEVVPAPAGVKFTTLAEHSKVSA
ncbi:hypothetical protein D3C85_1430570 [compost metagenome]